MRWPILTNVTSAIVCIFKRNAQVAGQSDRVSLHSASVDVQSTNSVGTDGSEPDIFLVGECADNSWSEKGWWYWVLRKFLRGRVELGHLLAQELADPDVSTGDNDDADWVSVHRWNSVYAHLPVVLQQSECVGGCLREIHL